MKPMFLFRLTWRGVKRLMLLGLQAAGLVLLAFIVVGPVTAIVAGFAMLLVARSVVAAVRAD